MVIYADYTYYEAEFGGSMIPAAEFPYYARGATQEINYQTYDRAIDWWNNPDEDNTILSDCTCAVAEVLYMGDKSNSMINPDSDSNIKLEIVGEYHVSREGVNTANESGQAAIARRVYDIIRKYLLTTNMLYKAVQCGYKR